MKNIHTQMTKPKKYDERYYYTLTGWDGTCEVTDTILRVFGCATAKINPANGIEAANILLAVVGSVGCSITRVLHR